MPIKEFECQACRHRFEEILGIHEPVPEKCPKCGGGPLKQLLGTFRIAGASRKSEPEGEFGGNEMGPEGDFGAGDEMNGMEDFGGGDDEGLGEGSEPPEDAGDDDSGAGPGEEPGGDDDKGNAE